MGENRLGPINCISQKTIAINKKNSIVKSEKREEETNKTLPWFIINKENQTWQIDILTKKAHESTIVQLRTYKKTMCFKLPWQQQFTNVCFRSL